MEDRFPYPLWTFRVPYHALWTLQWTCIFQHYINEIVREHLDVFCTAYLDDILIHINAPEEHENHVRTIILQKFQTAVLQVYITKCEFHATGVAYIGLIVTTQGIKMDPNYRPW